MISISYVTKTMHVTCFRPASAVLGSCREPCEVEVDEEHLDDASIEKAGKELARRIQDLMETLRGETAS